MLRIKGGHKDPGGILCAHYHPYTHRPNAHEVYVYGLCFFHRVSKLKIHLYYNGFTFPLREGEKKKLKRKRS